MRLVCVGLNMFSTTEYGGAYKGDYTVIHNVLQCKCPTNGRRYTLDVHVSCMDSETVYQGVDSIGGAILRCVDTFEGANMFPHETLLFELDDEYFVQLEKNNSVVITDNINNDIFITKNEYLFGTLVGCAKVNYSLFRG